MGEFRENLRMIATQLYEIHPTIMRLERALLSG